MEQEYWSSPENRYYQLRELVTELDFKAIRKDRLAEATRRAREKAWAEGEARCEARGLARGEARGEAKGIAFTAWRMLGMSFTPEQISQATGLSPDEVEALRGEFGN